VNEQNAANCASVDVIDANLVMRTVASVGLTEADWRITARAPACRTNGMEFFRKLLPPNDIGKNHLPFACRTDARKTNRRSHLERDHRWTEGIVVLRRDSSKV
jgi:hypothetical protein